MNGAAFLASVDRRRSFLAATAFAFAVLMLLLVGAIACVNLWQSWTDYSSAEQNFVQLRQRTGLAGLRLAVAPPSGSAAIEGQTATVAGAALQQRIGALIASAGGAVLSSELDLREGAAEGGKIALVVSFDIDQNGFQRVLYEIEAGMPVLTVDRLNAQTAPGEEKSAMPRLRAQFSVSGVWRVGS